MIRPLLALAFAALASSCSCADGPTTTGDGTFRISGQLMNGQSPGPDAKVEVKKSGAVLASTDARSGSFSLSVTLAGPETLLLAIRADGFAPIVRVIQANKGGRYELEEQVVALPALACAGTTCSSGGLVVEGLPAGTTGFGRAFNPVTEMDSFPGAFADSDGNMLISGAFATVELKNAAGQPVTSLAQAATLKMPIPKDTWGAVVDVVPGDAKITVPLYAFDEALATWKREGQAELVASDGTAIANTQLAAIRAKTYAGDVFASGPVTHFSTWNVDWPISSHGCITGVMVGADGGAQASVKVEVMGTTYTGRGPSIVTGADGRFCSDILRSEGPGEDVDNNGVTGEVQRVQVIATQDKEIYDGKEHQSPTAQGSCGGSCFDIGSVRLDESSRFPLKLCAVNGRVVDRSGVPADGVSLTAIGTGEYDDAVAMCPGSFDCMAISQVTRDGGLWGGTVVVREKLSVYATKADKPDPDTDRTAHGIREYRTCPPSPLEISLSTVIIQRKLTVSVSGSSISWTPATPVQVVAVEGGGTAKWIVSGTAITPPITYGQAPAGTITSVGPVGSLSSGDRITVNAAAMVNGDTVSSMGTYTVP